MPAPDAALIGTATLPELGRLPAAPAEPFDVRPVGANVIIEPMMRADRTTGGIYFAHEQELKRGRVVAVGHGRTHVSEDGTSGWVEPPPAQVGDVVMYGARWQGDEFVRHGRRYRTLEPEQVIAVIEDEDGEHLARVTDANY